MVVQKIREMFWWPAGLVLIFALLGGGLHQQLVSWRLDLLQETLSHGQLVRGQLGQRRQNLLSAVSTLWFLSRWNTNRTSPLLRMMMVEVLQSSLVLMWFIVLDGKACWWWNKWGWCYFVREQKQAKGGPTEMMSSTSSSSWPISCSVWMKHVNGAWTRCSVMLGFSPSKYHQQNVRLSLRGLYPEPSPAIRASWWQQQLLWWLHLAEKQRSC